MDPWSKFHIPLRPPPTQPTTKTKLCVYTKRNKNQDEKEPQPPNQGYESSSDPEPQDPSGNIRSYPPSEGLYSDDRSITLRK